MTAPITIGLLGFGEVGRTLADALAGLPSVSLAAWDVRFPEPGSPPSQALRERPSVRAADGAAGLGGGAGLVISAVTAAEDLAAAESMAPGLEPGAFVLDVNSVSPGTKRRCRDLIEAAGGRYVEAAIMSPIAPRGIASPVLLGGPHAAEFEPLARSLGMSGARVCSAETGVAAATKMCRSIVVKGMEALFAESLLAARHYGVEDDVVASLEDLLGRQDARTLARYLIGRSIEHGVRRAEEMREAAITAADAGLDPWMCRATVERQAWAAGFPAAREQQELTQLLDSIRSDMTC